MIAVTDHHVVICNGKHFGCVRMDDFLEALADRITPNDTGYVNFARMYVPPAEPPVQKAGEPLLCNVLFKHIQVSCVYQCSGAYADVRSGGQANKYFWHFLYFVF